MSEYAEDDRLQDRLGANKMAYEMEVNGENKMSKSADRFDLEQAILNCWGVSDDLRMAAEGQANAELLDAMAVLYDARFEVLFKVLTTMIEERKFKNEKS